LTHSNFQATALIEELGRKITGVVSERSACIGICSGGVLIRDHLLSVMPPVEYIGAVDIGLHRDDFDERGTASSNTATNIPFDIDGKEVLLIDDVIESGRTVRAAINELFDYGRPASIKLITLIDRGGRQIPVHPDFNGIKLDVGVSEVIRVVDSVEQGLMVHFSEKVSY